MNQRSKKLFILDTNVLMHDSTSLFRFHEHDIFLPMVVLEELDRNKSGHSEVARNARQASRFINEAIAGLSNGELSNGVNIHPYFDQNSSPDDQKCKGKLYFQTQELIPKEGHFLASHVNDNIILSVSLALKESYGDKVVLVSKDINLRIKAAIVGINAEDYFNDQVLDDADLLDKGFHLYEGDFWAQFDKDLESWSEDDGRSFYRVKSDEIATWFPNQGLFVSNEERDYIVRKIEGKNSAIIEALKDYKTSAIWGITARNKGQNFALNILLDPEIDFVTLLGVAGTGKTLLALAAGLHEVLDNKRYDQIIMTRATIPVGEDIGFLPGTEEEKMAPWMGALMDNLEVLSGDHKEEWNKNATNDLLSSRVKIKSLNFMRGRTFQNKWLIIDEAQNLTSKQMKTLITRAGPNTKVICLGNIAQIDTPFLTETTSGLTYAVDKFLPWEHSGHITLQQGERSRLAAYASDNL